MNQIKIVVIGAGLAGLTAAYRLHQKNLHVEVYEARSRVGGRVLSAEVNSRIVELGGQNIYDGGEALSFLRLAKEFELNLVHYPISLNHYYFHEGKLIKPTFPSVDRENLQEVAKKARNMKEILLHFFNEEDPLYKSLSVRLASYEGGPVEDLSPLYVDTLYHMLLGGISSCHQEDTVDLVTLEGGNSRLAEELAKRLNIHLESPLTKVSKNQDGSYTLSFQNKEKVTADILVLAIPASLYSTIIFENDVIPLDRLTSIQNIRYGSNAKMIFPMPMADEKKKILINDRAGCFFSNHGDMVTLYYTGNFAHFSEENIGTTYADDWEMLKEVFQEDCPSFESPAIAKDALNMSYKGPIAYSWPLDPFVKGTYAYIATGQETLLREITEEGDEQVKTLFAPIDDRLFFAGEHTSILLDVPGTMEAAVESGERISRIIQKKIR